MLASIVSIATILLTSTGVLAAPQATSTASLAPFCKGDYGPFQLFAKVSSDVSYPIRLIVDETTAKNVTSHMIVDLDDDCTDCGVRPNFWDLKSNQLIPGNSSAPAGVSTVNLDVVRGSNLGFITSRKSQPAYPIYCAQTTGVDTPPILSVHGSSQLFTICAFTSVFPPAKIFSVVYNKFNVQPVGVKCTPVQLVLNFIGIQ